MSVEIVAGRTTDKTYNTVESSDPLVWSNLTGRWHKVSSESAATVSEGEFTRDKFRADFTDSKVTSSAIYIQDTWSVTDQLVLNLGLRYSNVSNTVSDGRKYVDVKGHIAPRAQEIYDLNGDGETKIYATYGRYFSQYQRI